jgi:hypothetical protein
MRVKGQTLLTTGGLSLGRICLPRPLYKDPVESCILYRTDLLSPTTSLDPSSSDIVLAIHIMARSDGSIQENLDCIFNVALGLSIGWHSVPVVVVA